MRKLGLGLGLSRGRRGPSGPTYSVSISGLTSNPTYASTAQIGVELTASASGWSGDAPSSVSWQWYDGSGAISGATSATYTPVSGDDLEAIYATATPSDTYDPKNSVAYTVRYAPAVNTVAPVASGDTSLGDTLTTTNGTWTGATGGSYSYQWQRDGVDISGATASTYDIVAADDAADLRCVVTYTNSGGAVSANSNAVTVDDFAAPAITGSPTISGTEQVGQTLTATAASVTGTPTPSRTWQWVNSASGDISGATSSTYTLQASDEGDTISVRQTETNGLGSDTATSAATGAIAAAPAVATITINSIGPQEASGDVPTDYTIDQNDSGVEGLLRLSTTAAPGAADFGADSGGGADAGGYTDLGTVNLTVGGSAIDMPLPDGLDGSYIIDLLPTGGGDSDVASSAAVDIDTTAPVLSSPGGAANGSTGATSLGVTTDEGNGTLYWGIYPTASTPTAANVIAGTGATVSGSQAVSGTGAQAVSDQTGLTASTAYKTHYVHVDAVSNTSALSTSAEFTTASAGASVTVVANPTALAGGGSGPFTFTSVDLSAASEGDELYILAMMSDVQGDVTFTGCTVGGVSADPQVESGSASTNATCAIYRFVRGASSTANIVLTAISAYNPAFTKIIVYSVPGYDTRNDFDALNNDSAKSFTVDTTTDCVVFACSAAEFFDPGLSGVSNILSGSTGSRFWSAGYAIATVAEARAIATTEGSNSCLVAAVFTQGA